MAIYDFSPTSSLDDNPELLSIDKLPDHRSEVEQQFTPLALYQPESPDLAFAERVALEIINVSGAWTKIFTRTEDESYDDVWEEQTEPTYRPGKDLKGYFVPEPLGSELNKFGVDAPNKTEVVYSRANIFQEMGDRMIRPGDIIEIPFGSIERHRGGNRVYYRVSDAREKGNFKYRWLYYAAIIERITGDITIQVTPQSTLNG